MCPSPQPQLGHTSTCTHTYGLTGWPPCFLTRTPRAGDPPSLLSVLMLCDVRVCYHPTSDTSCAWVSHCTQNRKTHTHGRLCTHRYIYILPSISQTFLSRAPGSDTQWSLSTPVFWCACTLMTMYTPGLAYVYTHTCVLLQGTH